MNTAKIELLRENVGTWTAPDGKVFFKHNVQLDNGTQGTALGQNETAPYSVGDSVTYTETNNPDGSTRLKIKKEGGNYSGNSGGYSKRQEDPEKAARIMRQTAMKIAPLIVGAGQSWEQYKKVADQLVNYFNGTPQSVAPQVETRTETNTNSTGGWDSSVPF